MGIGESGIHDSVKKGCVAQLILAGAKIAMLLLYFGFAAFEWLMSKLRRSE